MNWQKVAFSTALCTICAAFVLADTVPRLGGSREIVKAWVNFDGTQCTGGPGGNECLIRDSYNVKRVVFNPAQPEYTIEWMRRFANDSYVFVALANDISTRLDVPVTPTSAIVQTVNAGGQLSTAAVINVIAIGTLAEAQTGE